MRDTLQDSMNELMQFAKGEPNEVTVKEYTLTNIPAYSDPAEIKVVRSKKDDTESFF